jgi:hypothetical protein
MFEVLPNVLLRSKKYASNFMVYFIPLKINNAMNNIYQLVLISCAILSLSSMTPNPSTIPKSEKFRFPKRVWSQGFRIRDCVPVPIDESTRRHNPEHRHPYRRKVACSYFTYGISYFTYGIIIHCNASTHC